MVRGNCAVLLIAVFTVASGCGQNAKNGTAISTKTSAATPTSKSSPVPAARPGNRSPQFAAMLVIHCGPKGVDSASCGLDIGKLGNSGGFSGEGTLYCGPNGSHSTLKYHFNKHQNGADHYTFERVLTNKDGPQPAKTKEVAFSGKMLVLFEDEHYITLRPKAVAPQ
jgi:hypothetical protein